MCIEVIHQRLSPSQLDIEYRQLPDPFGQQRMGHRSPGTASTHLHHMTTWHVAQAATEAFGETQAVGVVADTLAVLEHHGIDRANASGFGGEVIEQRQDCLFAREGDVQAGVTHGFGSAEQLLQGAAVEFQLIQVDQPVQVVKAQGLAFVLVQCRGA
ncbi:hypothetical protein D3C80_1202090 [compost metagenome]